MRINIVLDDKLVNEAFSFVNVSIHRTSRCEVDRVSSLYLKDVILSAAKNLIAVPKKILRYAQNDIFHIL